MADNNKKIIYTVEVNDKGKVKIEGLTKGFVKLENGLKKVNVDLREQQNLLGENNKSLDKNIDKTGLAGATVVEMGRAISDSNYGIRGMANNLSQLSTLMITLITTTGGVANGLRALWSALAGPLGVIIVFQTIITLFEKYDMDAKKAEKSSTSFAGAIADSVDSLNDYLAVIEDIVLTQDQLNTVLEGAAASDKKLDKFLRESNLSQEEKNELIKEYLEVNQLLNVVNTKISEEEAKRRELDNFLTKQELEDLEKKIELHETDEQLQLTGVANEVTIKLLKNKLKLAKEDISNSAESVLIESELLKLRARLLEQQSDLTSGGKSAKDKKFKASQLDFEKETIKSQGRISASLIRNNELRVKEEFDTIRELAVLKQKDFAEAQQRRVDAITDEKLKAKAQKKVNKEIANSEESLVKYIIQLRAERDRTINQMRIDDLSNASSLMEKEQGVRKQSALEFNSFLALTNKQRFDADIELEKLKTEIIIQELEQQIEVKRIAGESTIGLEEKLDRVREKLSQTQVKRGVKLIDEEAKRINGIIKATQGAFSQLSNVFTSYTDARIEALARERDYVLNSETLTGEAQKKRIEDIQRRELQAQKNKIRLERELFTIKQSMLIAEQVMKANAIIMENKLKIANDMREVGSAAVIQASKAKMSVGTFVSKGGLKGLATYAITIGGLLASIFAARKKAQSELASLGGPSVGAIGGGGGGVEAPDFNVVGASPESQLAQSVSQQQQQPLRAFVVHKDIKNANELDRKITEPTGL